MKLSRLDVRVKIAGFASITAMLFLLSHPLGNALLLVALLGALAAAGTPLGGLWRALEPLLVVMILIVAVAMVASGQTAGPQYAHVLFSFWGLDATVGGLLVGLNFVARILLMVTATYAFTISTPIDDLLAVLSQVRAPYWLSILITTALAFVPTMATKKDQIIEAQRARGGRAKSTGPLGQILAFVPIMVPMITNSILLADDLAVALTNRGYGASKTMTNLHDLSLRPSDLAVLGTLVAVLAAVCWLRFGLGYGVV